MFGVPLNLIEVKRIGKKVNLCFNTKFVFMSFKAVMMIEKWESVSERKNKMLFKVDYTNIFVT